MQFQLLLLNNLNQHISLFISNHLHFGTSQWEWCCHCDCHQILPQGSPQLGQAAREKQVQRNKAVLPWKGVGIPSIVPKFFTWWPLQNRLRVTGIIRSLDTKIQGFYGALFKPSHCFTYKFNLSEAAWQFKPSGRRIP